MLKKFGITEIVIFYGYGRMGNIDNLWKEKQINIDYINQFVQEGINSGMFTPSTCDLFIKNKEFGLNVQFCHDSDIHLKCDKAEFVDAKKEIWKKKGFLGYTKVEDKWIPFNEGDK